MINEIKNFYNSKDLYPNGEALIWPLKTYHNFFAQKIEQSSGLTKIALIIANIATGIFAYPLFGLLAGMGLFNKWRSIPALEKYNQREKNGIDTMCQSIQHTESHSMGRQTFQEDAEMNLVQEFRVTRENLNDISGDIKRTIDTLSDQFRKAYIKANGTINQAGGQIIIQIWRNG